MIRRHMFMSALVATVALSGCGGDQGSSATPTPTGTPTPTPTASPTYAGGGGGGGGPSRWPARPSSTLIMPRSATPAIRASGAVTLGAASTEALIPTPAARVRSATDTAVATGTYVMRENTEEVALLRADRPDLHFDPGHPLGSGQSRNSSSAPTTRPPPASSCPVVEFLNNVVKDTSTNTCSCWR